MAYRGSYTFFIFLNIKKSQTMKRPMIFLMIAVVIALGFTLQSCQSDEIRTGIEMSETSVSARDECDPCDGMNECCCFVQLRAGTSVSLHLCGTSNGASACSGSAGICNSPMSGGGQVITLSDADSKKIFCMLEQHAIRIINQSTTDNAVIRIGCNTTSILPIDYTIPPQDSVKAEVNATCEMSDCTE